MKEALLKYVPFVPVLDNLTDAASAFAQRYPALAIDLWASLLVFEHPHANTSELRNWVLHILNLTGVASMPLDASQVQTLVDACVQALPTTRRRHVAKRIHAFQATLADAFQYEQADGTSSDVLVYLDHLAMNVGSHAAKGLACSVEFMLRWPPSSAPAAWKIDRHVVHRIKLLASMYPELFQSMLQHWMGLQYISVHEFNHVFRHSREFEAILGTVTSRHAVTLHRLTTSAVFWRTQCATGDVHFIQTKRTEASSEVGPFASVWPASLTLEPQVVDALLEEFDVALKHAPRYAFGPVALGLWALLGHMNGNLAEYRGQAAAATRLFLVSTLDPMACKIESEKLFVVVALMMESRWATWAMWTPGLTKRAVEFLAKTIPESPSKEAKWAAHMMLQHFVLDSIVVQDIQADVLPPGARRILQCRREGTHPVDPESRDGDDE
ncbi:hypothetical protein H310_03407 [Aphanomyces invadans]|uniref:Uncharacterized protein n=1 Tax=Aphanomyces invadans TaxID=157072 RepID=A0A024UJ81_9STRA|nr:hypothetical protein H310_03407 [Aphanomyces invadans]ETW05688.1 hypothetical protein H310_03407 [Aphanomyces invadans]|eukprot:XP_008865465.1 hypothetical protein H310_03407 [Aphanomyces invadans]